MPKCSFVLLVALALIGCASSSRPFPARAPLWRDTDLDAMNVPCRPDPEHPGRELCRPESTTSSFLWDAADQQVFRPISRFFAVAPGGEAVNVNSLDEVPDSSWFVNRLGRRAMTREELAAGPCGEQVIATDGEEGSWVIDQGKANGANPGFRVRLPDGTRYMLKADVPDQPEKATAATAIAARLYHAAGWYAPCDTVVHIDPRMLTLTPGLTVTDNWGATRPFDRAALDRVLEGASWRGGLVRFAASRWLPGRPLGPFTYSGIAEDEPGDVIAHEDRRDLRGARLMAAWLNHWDSREQNTMRVWISDDVSRPDASPGRVLHYIMDLGDCFGSERDDEVVARRMGHVYFLDVGAMLADFVTFGLVTRPWHRAARHREDGGIFAFFHADGFDPEAWRGNYPNPAFGRMTERDGAWAARILSRFSDELIAEAVRAGDFTNPRHTAFLIAQLVARRDAILRRYLSRLSPIADLTVRGGELCGVDLGRRARIVAADRYAYDAGGLPVTVGPAGAVCVTLPSSSGYHIVSLRNGHARGALRAHVLDGKLVGIERSSS